MRVVATAGHVDHGKSTLVQALTGVDPDRLPEEKARGLTIDLGFAVAELPSGEEIAFVDVPGHRRFVGNMLAGVGSVDACLLVVAATEGWKEQSEEHLRILELLGIRHGLVALTKVGLVDRIRVGSAAAGVRDHLAGTFLEPAEMVEVDVPAGIGVADLQQALDRLARAAPTAPDLARPRLWVDRAFSIRGTGTVVTGTLRDGALTTGMELVAEPTGRSVRVRSMQSHHRSLDEARPGRRLALNLSGVGQREIGRGQALVRPGQWYATGCVDATLTVLASLDHPVERRGAFSLHAGSGDFPVRLRVLRGGGIEPGDTGPVRLWLRPGTALPFLPGDRYVLREAGRFETVGGGQILDVEPVLPASRAAPSISTERVVQERGWVEAGHLGRITGEAVRPTVGRWVVAPDAKEAAIEGLLEQVLSAGRHGLDLARLDDRHRALVPLIPGVRSEAGRLVAAGPAGPGVSPAAGRLLATLEAAGWSPPALPVSDRGSLRELQRAGLAVEAGEAWFAASAVRSAVARLAELLESRPAGFTVADARDALGSSRKHVLPLLGHLDSVGVTRRRGDHRVAGARLARFLAEADR
jgi:selenocysteine-specific elongation factor